MMRMIMQIMRLQKIKNIKEKNIYKINIKKKKNF